MTKTIGVVGLTELDAIEVHEHVVADPPVDERAEARRAVAQTVNAALGDDPGVRRETPAPGTRIVSLRRPSVTTGLSIDDVPSVPVTIRRGGRCPSRLHSYGFGATRPDQQAGKS
jgi:hypothetical protein